MASFGGHSPKQTRKQGDKAPGQAKSVQPILGNSTLEINSPQDLKTALDNFVKQEKQVKQVWELYCVLLVRASLDRSLKKLSLEEKADIAQNSLKTIYPALFFVDKSADGGAKQTPVPRLSEKLDIAFYLLKSYSRNKDLVKGILNLETRNQHLVPVSTPAAPKHPKPFDPNVTEIPVAKDPDSSLAGVAAGNLAKQLPTAKTADGDSATGEKPQQTKESTASTTASSSGALKSAAGPTSDQPGDKKSGGDPPGGGGRKPTYNFDFTSNTVASMTAVPATYNALHCDPQAPPGKVPVTNPDYVVIMIKGNSDLGAPGSALFFKTETQHQALSQTRFFTPSIAAAVGFYEGLKELGLDPDEKVDLDKLGEKDKIELVGTKKLFEGLTEHLNKLLKAKDLLVKSGSLKGTSIKPLITFFKDLTSTLEEMKVQTSLYLHRRKGADNITFDDTLNLTSDPSDVSVGASMSAGPSPLANMTLGGSKLPKLDAKVFSGKSEDFLRWRTDWTTYFARFRQAGEIGDYQLMSYLQSSMPKGLKEEMSSYSWDKEGYTAWMTELESRFGNTNHLLMTYRKNLQNLSPPKDVLSSFATFRHKITDILRGMALLKVNSSRDGEQWMSYLLPKLTETQSTDWIGYKRLIEVSQPAEWASKVPFEHFVEWMALFEKTEREKALQMTLVPKDKSKGGGGGGHKATTHSTSTVSTKAANTVTVTTAAADAKPKKKKKTGKKENTGTPVKRNDVPYKSEAPKKCCFCKSSGHHPKACNADNDPDKMWEAVFQDNLCYACLQNGHRPPKCRAKKVCPKKNKDGTPCVHSHAPVLHDAVYKASQNWHAQAAKRK